MKLSGRVSAKSCPARLIFCVVQGLESPVDVGRVIVEMRRQAKSSRPMGDVHVFGRQRLLYRARPIPIAGLDKYQR